MDDIGGECSSHVSMGLVRVVEEAQFQGDEALCSQLDGLHWLPLLPVPDSQRISVLCWYLRRIEALHRHKKPEPMRNNKAGHWHPSAQLLPAWSDKLKIVWKPAKLSFLASKGLYF